MGLFGGGNSSSTTNLSKDQYDQSTNIGATETEGGNASNAVDAHKYQLGEKSNLNISTSDTGSFAKLNDTLNNSFKDLLNTVSSYTSDIFKNEQSARTELGNTAKVIAGKNNDTLAILSKSAQSKAVVSDNDKKVIFSLVSGAVALGAIYIYIKR